MSKQFERETISRRIAADCKLRVPLVSLSEAETQTSGMNRRDNRQDRRTERKTGTTVMPSTKPAQ